MSAETSDVNTPYLILNVPHSSTIIPIRYRELFLVGYISDELRIMTDWYTDELFNFPGAKIIKAELSRLVIDMERFWNDDEEPMSKVGMGAVYSRTSRGDRLIENVLAQRTEMQSHYSAYHKELETAVDMAIAHAGKATIIDCHSFSSVPLPHEADKSYPRPDICIGTDSFHTPGGLAGLFYSYFTKKGFSVTFNSPFSGSIVPIKHYKKDRNVMSIMIEINRSLYMDELSTSKTEGYEKLKTMLYELLGSV